MWFLYFPVTHSSLSAVFNHRDIRHQSHDKNELREHHSEKEETGKGNCCIDKMLIV